MDKTKIEQFYTKWQANLPQRIEGYIYDENKRMLPTRFMFAKFKKVIEKFLNNELSEIEKVVLMPGIRGIGKTTLLAQTYAIEKFLKPKDRNLLENIGKLEERLYLDVSQLRSDQISLNEFFNFYEEIREFHFEKPQKKILILLDEVHFDENWGLFLKTIFDRTKGHRDVLVIATGSSALQIKMIPDLGRRTDIWEIFPMKLNEYLILKYGKYPLPGLSDYLQDALFNSSNANEVFERLKIKSQEIRKFFVESVPPKSETDFFESGSFPSAIRIENKQKAIEKIKSVIDGIIAKDIITLQKFKTQTIAKIGDLLYLLAQSDLISYSKLKEALKIERVETLESLIEVLVMSGVLVKVKTYGTTYGSTRKTPKLLFVTPSLRSAVLNNIYLSGIEGKKLEDYFALIYLKDLKSHSKYAINLSYDLAEAGADFVLTLKDRSNIVIEVGFNKNEIEQVRNTMKKVKSRYGLVFGSSELELINDSIVKVPLRFLILI
ncbi:MAG: AAA family ATPase [Candidatus Nealsonbacteria bacterium]|nr:AAA family ATPase [Candidatus Nealsonbacteria bacterium]